MHIDTKESLLSGNVNKGMCKDLIMLLIYGGVDIVFPEYPGLTAHAEPGEDVAEVGYKAFQNAPARIKKESVCSVCGQKYNGYPVLSRKYGTTEICPDSGMREAFAAFGYEPEQIEENIAEIYRLQTANAIAEVHNSSSLFTGDAGSGESNARRYLIENDLVEAIIAVPENMFCNTSIGTFIWILSL